MSRRAGFITAAVLRHAQKHQRLAKFLAQGQRRALERSAKAAVDIKARAVLSTFNLGSTSFRGLNRIKRAIRVAVFGDQAVERVTSGAGIPLRDYGATPTPRGVRFSIRRGRQVRLRSGFVVDSIGRHAFTRRGHARLPIRKRYGPGLAFLMDRTEVRTVGNQAFRQRVRTELRKQETQALRRSGL